MLGMPEVGDPMGEAAGDDGDAVGDPVSDRANVEAGMAKMAEEFRAHGSELYMQESKAKDTAEDINHDLARMSAHRG